MKKILILNSDSAHLVELAGLLRREKFEVLTGTNGLVGLELAMAERPDLIITDLGLSGMDGYGLFRTLRSTGYEKFHEIPFLFISPTSAASWLPRSASHVWVITSPIDDSERTLFLQIVERILGGGPSLPTEIPFMGYGDQILVCSRNTDVVNHLQSYLEDEARYRVTIAFDREEVMARNEAVHYSCLFLDISGNGEPSLEWLIRKLRLKNNTLGIILLADENSKETAVRMLRLGASDYLVLPFAEWEVHEAVKTVSEVMKIKASCNPASARMVELNSLLQKRNMELAFLQNIAARLSLKEGTEELSEIIIDGLRDIVDYDVATIMFLEGTELRIAAQRGLPDDAAARDLRFDAEANPRLRKVVAEKNAILFHDPEETDPFDGIMQIKKVHSCLIAPMVLNDRIIGVITVDNQVPDLYDDDTLRLVSTLAHHAAASFERAERHHLLETMAITDSLTGIYNRRFMDKALEHEEARAKRTGRPISVVMIDLDGVKLVNDRFGHEEGDNFLKRVAHLLRENCRVIDSVARYGGDEFVVLMPETTLYGAQRYVKLIQKKIDSDPGFRLSDYLTVGISLGAACTSETKNLAEALRLADARMYTQKREKGRMTSPDTDQATNQITDQDLP